MATTSTTTTCSHQSAWIVDERNSQWRRRDGNSRIFIPILTFKLHIKYERASARERYVVLLCIPMHTFPQATIYPFKTQTPEKWRRVSTTLLRLFCFIFFSFYGFSFVFRAFSLFCPSTPSSREENGSCIFPYGASLHIFETAYYDFPRDRITRIRIRPRIGYGRCLYYAILLNGYIKRGERKIGREQKLIKLKGRIRIANLEECLYCQFTPYRHRLVTSYTISAVTASSKINFISLCTALQLPNKNELWMSATVQIFDFSMR